MDAPFGRWLAVPRAHANALALATATVAMAIVMVFDEPYPEGDGTLLRGRALIIAAVHAMFHGFALKTLGEMAARRLDGAEAALATYRDPRRISHLDLAAAWFALFALAPYVARA